MNQSRVRFLHSPIHLLCMRQSHTISKKQFIWIQSKVCKMNVRPGLCGNLCPAVMLIVLECRLTHDMSLYIERQTDCWVCWWMNSRNNHPTHPPFPLWYVVKNWEMLGTVRISYNITQQVVWSLLEFLTVPWDPQYVPVPDLAPADKRI